MSLHRQTVSFLQQRLAEAGIRPQVRHGQNFLVDLNLLDVLVREAQLEAADLVLEIGTGTGALTSRLAERVATVVTVELDPQLAQLASEELADAPNVIMLHQDALRNKNHLHDRVLEVMGQQLERHRQRFKLVANLPYSIATPVISNLLLTPITPVSMTVTIQKELAERLVAVPSTKDYSALSVWVQSLCAVEILRVLPPTVFWPRPKVESAFIRVVPDPERRAAFTDLPDYHRFVRATFFHRRKFLRSVLISNFKQVLEKSGVDAVMRECELGPDVRAEQLSIPEIQRLYRACPRLPSDR